jgi:hypothetical protein
MSTEFGSCRSRFISYRALPSTPQPTSCSSDTDPCSTIGKRNLRSNTIADVVAATTPAGSAI